MEHLKIEVKKYVKKNGKISHYPRIVEYVAGKRKRHYIKVADAGYFLGYHIFQEETRKFTARPKGNKIGRPASLPAVLKDIISKCGYSAYGTRIERSRKNYFSKASVVARFNMLNKDERNWVGSSGKLLSACLEARRRLMTGNRKSRHLTWDDCLAQVISEIHG